MKSVGILYICTGPYYLFWEDFYKSFEKYFLPGYEKKYFVFTDAEKIYAQDNKNVKKVYLQALPWPLITLLRFNTFLSIEDDISTCDYLMFSNANMVCNTTIMDYEFLPRQEMNEAIFVTKHPGYAGKDKFRYPYDRNKGSLAYIPWNCGEEYVIGAMFGGTSQAFIKMSKVLKRNIEEDLKSNVIAKWHDESHLNRYIIGRKDLRILSPQYCYPYGMNVAYERKISAVSKQAKFDVKKFKGNTERKNYFTKAIIKAKEGLALRSRVLFLYDMITGKTIKEMADENDE